MPQIIIDFDEVHRGEIVSIARDIRKFLAEVPRLRWAIGLANVELSPEQQAWIMNDDAPLPKGAIDWTRKPRRPRESDG